LPGYKILNEENYESQGGPSAGKKRKVVTKKRVSVEKQSAEESLELQQAVEEVQTFPAPTAGYVGVSC
jgi:hypothetical protein